MFLIIRNLNSQFSQLFEMQRISDKIIYSIDINNKACWKHSSPFNLLVELIKLWKHEVLHRHYEYLLSLLKHTNVLNEARHRGRHLVVNEAGSRARGAHHNVTQQHHQTDPEGQNTQAASKIYYKNLLKYTGASKCTTNLINTAEENHLSCVSVSPSIGLSQIVFLGAGSPWIQMRRAISLPPLFPNCCCIVLV